MIHLPDRLTRLAGVAVVAAGLTLGATGIAVAATGGGTAPPHQAAVPSPTPVTPLPGQTQPRSDQGTGDFTPPGEHAEQPDPGEQASGAETTSATDPEPNHQDANGSNVDHTPAGAQPEAPGSTQG